MKIYKIYQLDISSDNEHALEIARDVASKILINPVINSYSVKVVEEIS